MTSRHLIGAWLAALALVCGAIGLLLHIAGPDQHPFRQVEIAVIGSSLSRHAIPEYGGGTTSLLGDGRAHRRFAPNSPNESMELALFEAALDDRVKLVLLEINPFIRDVNITPPGHSCDDRQTALRTSALEGQLRIALSFRRLLGFDIQTREGTGEPLNLGNDQIIRPEWMESTYPLRLHQPSCRLRLERLLARARNQGTSVAFLLPPRSHAAAAFMPPGQERELGQLAKQVAGEFQLPIFAPASPWSNAMFTDNSHINWRGRQRFVAELRQWWAGLQ